LNPQAEEFTSFDQGQQHTLLSGLHLDQEEEPRRGASRANSVRFDESAIQGHWAQGSRSSGDFPPPRTGSGLSSHPMTERSSSHKSDGRHSSLSHSIHSTRANSFGFDATPLLASDLASSSDVPDPPPGLFILGTVPSIIRCWLDTTFSHETLLYAAVCTGSFVSSVDVNLIRRLELDDEVSSKKNGISTIRMPVYLPEATVLQTISRSNPSTPQLPTLTAEFEVTGSLQEDSQAKKIEVIIGSNTLRAHNADVLFSRNILTLYGDDRSKLSIPLVRPENDSTFRTLHTTKKEVESRAIQKSAYVNEQVKDTNIITKVPTFEDSISGHDSGVSVDGNTRDVNDYPRSLTPSTSPLPSPSPDLAVIGSGRKSSQPNNTIRPNHSSRPSLSNLKIPDDGSRDVEPTQRKSVEFADDRLEAKLEQNEMALARSASQRSPGGGIWNSWRRDSSSGSKVDGLGNIPLTSSGYQPPGSGRGRGMKVLRPSNSKVSAHGSYSTSPGLGIDKEKEIDRHVSHVDGNKTRSGFDNGARGSSREPKAFAEPNSETTPSKKVSSSNPIGGASAFAWLSTGR
jgi:hypothetical protein